MTPRLHTADVFISHASEDKEKVARPLAEMLRSRGLAVWYDDYVLRLGDSLREVIDQGLSSCRFGIVILSPAFFSKEWPRRELNGLLARETVGGAKVLLPVWHNVTVEDVLRFSPPLADKLAVSTHQGLSHVIQQILEALDWEEVSRGPANGLESRQEVSQAVEDAEPRVNQEPTAPVDVPVSPERPTETPTAARLPRTSSRILWLLSGAIVTAVALALYLNTWTGRPTDATTGEPSGAAVPAVQAAAIPSPSEDRLGGLQELRARQGLLPDVLLGLWEAVPDPMALRPFREVTLQLVTQP